jgi:hypothetical protein
LPFVFASLAFAERLHVALAAGKPHFTAASSACGHTRNCHVSPWSTDQDDTRQRLPVMAADPKRGSLEVFEAVPG